MNEKILVDFRKRKIELLKNFHNECEKAGAWYSLDGATLLGAMKYGGFSPYNDKISVMMTAIGYESLKKFNHGRVIDNMNTTRYRDNLCYFIELEKTNKNAEKDEMFIEITLVEETNKESWNEYINNRKWFKYLFGRDSYKTCLYELYTERPSMTAWIRKYRFHDTKKSVFPRRLSYDREFVSFAGIKLYAATESKELLKHWYGDDWLTQKFKPRKFKVNFKRDDAIEFRG